MAIGAGQLGTGQQHIDRLAPVGIDHSGLGAIPAVVTLRFLAQGTQVDQALKFTADRQAEVLGQLTVGPEQADRLAGEGNRALRRVVAALAPAATLGLHAHGKGAFLAALHPKRRPMGLSGKAQLLHHHGPRRGLPVAGLKPPGPNPLLDLGPAALGPLEGELNRELPLGRTLAQNAVEIAEMEATTTPIGAKVEMDAAVDRVHRLLEQQQALNQRRFA